MKWPLASFAIGQPELGSLYHGATTTPTRANDSPSLDSGRILLLAAACPGRWPRFRRFFEAGVVESRHVKIRGGCMHYIDMYGISCMLFRLLCRVGAYAMKKKGRLYCTYSRYVCTNTYRTVHTAGSGLPAGTRRFQPLEPCGLAPSELHAVLSLPTVRYCCCCCCCCCCRLRCRHVVL